MHLPEWIYRRGFAGDDSLVWIYRRGFVGVDLLEWIYRSGFAGVDFMDLMDRKYKLISFLNNFKHFSVIASISQ